MIDGSGFQPRYAGKSRLESRSPKSKKQPIQDDEVSYSIGWTAYQTGCLIKPWRTKLQSQNPLTLYP